MGRTNDWALRVWAGFLTFLLFAVIVPAPARAAAPTAGDYGTVSAVDAAGAVTLVLWGQVETRALPTNAGTAVTIAAAPGKVADLKEGMWIKVDSVGGDGVATKISAGQFMYEEGDKIVIFKGMPETFLLTNHAGWYTNEVAGMKYKIQPMEKDPALPIVGTNLRAAKYKEPAGGFVVYMPLTLKGIKLGYAGVKPGAAVPDADGKILINKETAGESYWKHPNNPHKPEAGYGSGLSELTIRGLPVRTP